MRIWWTWTQRVFYLAASTYLFFAAVCRFYYFHDEMSCHDSKLLNPSYSNQIQVETYLMSRANLIELFKGNPPKPDMTPFSSRYEDKYEYEKSSSPRFYLVVRLKNEGDQIAWGVLNASVDGEITHEIQVPPLPPKMDQFELIALKANQRDKREFSKKLDYPNIASTWHLLFTQKEKK